MGIADGYYVLVLVATALVLLSLYLFLHVERWMDNRNQVHHYKITSRYSTDLLTHYEALFSEYHLKFRRLKQIKTSDTLSGVWLLTGSKKAHSHFTRRMLLDTSVTEFEF
jgi:putative Mg2+ transporter-C (MgtC) family protein